MTGRLAHAAFALQVAALWTLAWAPGAARLPFPALGLWAIAFSAYAFAAGRADALSRRQLWAGGVLARLGLLPLAPRLSEDLYRYLWDGWVQRNGVNPFVHPPGAEALSDLRLEWWSTVNHPDVSTIYPPGAQLVFFALAWSGPALWIFKLVWLAADLGVARLIERLSPDGSRVPLFLWLASPLLIVEVAWSGHMDPLGILLMLGAVALAGGGAGWRAGVALGLGASVKFAPLAGVPALFRRGGWRPAVAALFVVVALYIPYASAGGALFSGLRTYADTWAFNAGVYALLASLIGSAGAAKWVAAIVVGGIVGTATWRGWTLGRTLFWALGASLVLSPTIHPWYLLWVLPFACLVKSRGWILYTGTIFLAYAGRDAYLTTGSWPEPVWLTWTIHAPPLLLLAGEAWRGRAERFGGGREVPGRE